jgi:hypothetical protein
MQTVGANPGPREKPPWGVVARHHASRRRLNRGIDTACEAIRLRLTPHRIGGAGLDKDLLQPIKLTIGSPMPSDEEVDDVQHWLWRGSTVAEEVPSFSLGAVPAQADAELSLDHPQKVPVLVYVQLSDLTCDPLPKRWA